MYRAKFRIHSTLADSAQRAYITLFTWPSKPSKREIIKKTARVYPFLQQVRFNERIDHVLLMLEKSMTEHSNLTCAPEIETATPNTTTCAKVHGQRIVEAHREGRGSESSPERKQAYHGILQCSQGPDQPRLR